MGADEYGVGLSKTRKSTDEVDPNLPTVFALYQNMPNPFNPMTTIRYDIPVTKGRMVNYPAVLQIFDIRGRLVRSLVNTVRRPGRYAVQWDGRADNGQAIASGMFIYKLQAGNFISKKKMVLIK
jgi:hypothetical protein